MKRGNNVHFDRFSDKPDTKEVDTRQPLKEGQLIHTIGDLDLSVGIDFSVFQTLQLLIKLSPTNEIIRQEIRKHYIYQLFERAELQQLFKPFIKHINLFIADKVYGFNEFSHCVQLQVCTSPSTGLQQIKARYPVNEQMPQIEFNIVPRKYSNTIFCNIKRKFSDLQIGDGRQLTIPFNMYCKYTNDSLLNPIGTINFDILFLVCKKVMALRQVIPFGIQFYYNKLNELVVRTKYAKIDIQFFNIAIDNNGKEIHIPPPEHVPPKFTYYLALDKLDELDDIFDKIVSQEIQENLRPPTPQKELKCDLHMFNFTQNNTPPTSDNKV